MKKYIRDYTKIFEEAHKYDNYVLCITLDELQILKRRFDGPNSKNRLENWDLIKGEGVCQGVKLALTTITKGK